MGRLCGTQTPLKKPMCGPLHQQRSPPGGVRARHRARAAACLQVTTKGWVPEGGLWHLDTARVQAAGVFSINSNRVSLVKPCSSTQRACHSSANNLSSAHIPRHPSLRNQKHTHTPFSASPVLRPRQPPHGLSCLHPHRAPSRPRSLLFSAWKQEPRACLSFLPALLDPQ